MIKKILYQLDERNQFVPNESMKNENIFCRSINPMIHDCPLLCYEDLLNFLSIIQIPARTSANCLSDFGPRNWLIGNQNDLSQKISQIVK